MPCCPCRRLARPIAVDKRAISVLVEQVLVPGIVAKLKRLPATEPIGAREGLARGHLSVEAADSRSTDAVNVRVDSRPTRAKGAAVLGGSFHKEVGEIRVVVNGALSPNDFLVPTQWSDRLSPLHDCTHETCLAFGLYSILLHEVTHAADTFMKPVSYDPQKIRDRDESESAAYMNDPGEVRAFMQEIVDAAVRAARKIRTHVTSDAQLIRTVLRLSTTWSIVSPHLTEQNRRRIVKAVYEALDRDDLLT